MKSTFTRYLVYSVITIIITEYTKNILNINQLLYQSLSEQFTTQQISRIFTIQEKWQWVIYVFVPFYILLKTIILSSILFVGTFIFNKTAITFKQLWAIVIKAEFVFLLVGIFKLI